MSEKLIERYLPQYDVRSYYETWIRSKPKQLYPLVRDLDFSDSLVIRFLFKLRGIHLNKLNLSGLLKDQDFQIIDEIMFRELLVGFGSPTINSEFRESRTFLGINKNQYIIAWNFTLEARDRGTCLATETRVKCLTPKAKVIFRIYWFFIGPFSGWIRRIMLALVKKKGEEIPPEKTNY